MGLSLLTACTTSGGRADSSRVECYTPATRANAPHVTLLSFGPAPEFQSKPHYVGDVKPLKLRARKTPAMSLQGPEPKLRPASARTQPIRRPIYVDHRPVAYTLETVRHKLPRIDRIKVRPAANDFYVTLGTGIVDPEKDANWTSAAVYPQVPPTRELPAMRVMGQSSRSKDHIQVAPGFFWWATDSCCLSVAVPVRVVGTASNWGLLLALNF